MGKSIPATIAGEHFNKKSDLEIRIRLLIKNYNLMDFLNEKDKAFCLDLFARHPRFSEKSAPGIKAIQVRADDYGNRNFHLHYANGTDDDISWHKCVAAIK